MSSGITLFDHAFDFFAANSLATREACFEHLNGLYPSQGANFPERAKAAIDQALVAIRGNAAHPQGAGSHHTYSVQAEPSTSQGTFAALTQAKGPELTDEELNHCVKMHLTMKKMDGQEIGAPGDEAIEFIKEMKKDQSHPLYGRAVAAFEKHLSISNETVAAHVASFLKMKYAEPKSIGTPQEEAIEFLTEVGKDISDPLYPRVVAAFKEHEEALIISLDSFLRNKVLEGEKIGNPEEAAIEFLAKLGKDKSDPRYEYALKFIRPKAIEYRIPDAGISSAIDFGTIEGLLSPKGRTISDKYQQFTFVYISKALKTFLAEFKIKYPEGVDKLEGDALKDAISFIAKLDKEITILGKGLDTAKSALDDQSFEFYYALYCVKNYSARDADDFFDCVKENPIFSKIANDSPIYFKKNVNLLEVLKNPDDKGFFDKLFGSFQNHQQMNVKNHFPTFEFIEELCRKPNQDFERTRFYQEHLVGKLQLTPAQIEGSLLAIQERIKGQSPSESRTAAILYLAANQHWLAERLECRENFKGISAKELDLAIRYFQGKKLEPDQKRTGRNILIKLGNKLSRDKQSYSDIGRVDVCLKSILTGNELAVLNQKDLWISRAEQELEKVQGDLLLYGPKGQFRTTEGNAHEYFSHHATDLNPADLTETEQFRKDKDRYEKMLIVTFKDKKVSFPGNFPSKKAAKEELKAHLRELADGNNEWNEARIKELSSIDPTMTLEQVRNRFDNEQLELQHLVQELATQTPKNGADLWLDKMLREELDQEGFILFRRSLSNPATAIHRVNENTVVAECDLTYEVTNNRLQMKEADNHTKEYPTIRVRYELNRTKDGWKDWKATWTKINKWIPIQKNKPLEEIYKPVPAQPAIAIDPVPKPPLVSEIVKPSSPLGGNSSDAVESV